MEANLAMTVVCLLLCNTDTYLWSVYLRMKCSAHFQCYLGSVEQVLPYITREHRISIRHYGPWDAM
jgi:hypothetical protein